MKNIAGLLLGIGLFLFGIEMMQETAESLYSEKMKKVIGSLTGNRIRSALTGAAVTGVIQSSCATTVMTLGFEVRIFSVALRFSAERSGMVRQLLFSSTLFTTIYHSRAGM